MFAMAYELMGWEEASYNIYTWDIYQIKGVDEGSRFHKRIKRITENFSESQIAEDLLKTLKGKTMFFIDGDHTEEGCRKDFLKIIPFLKQEDIVMFHDARTHMPIKEAINSTIAKTNLVFSKRFQIPSSRGMEILII